MFYLKVISLLLTLCLWHKTSAQRHFGKESPQEILSGFVNEISDQENSEEESPRVKLMGIWDITTAQKNSEEESSRGELSGLVDEISARENSVEESPREKLIDSSDEISAQANSKEESRPKKLIGVLQKVVDKYGEMSEDSSIAVENWLKKPLKELTASCGRKHILEAKIESYNTALFQILYLLNESNDSKPVDFYPLVLNLESSLLKDVLFQVEICVEYSHVLLFRQEKFHIIATVFREIARRISYIDQLTSGDLECFKKRRTELFSCKQYLHEVSEQSLFLVLLGPLRPQHDTCEENLPFKICRLDVVRNCGENLIRFIKLMISPPGGSPCNNLEKW